MAAVTTERLMQIALEMAGMTEVPPDSRVEYAGTRISHILFGIDVGPAELFMARQLGFHAVIAQRPYAVPAEAWRLYDWHRDILVRMGVSEADADRAIQLGVRRLRQMALQANQDVMPSVARLVETPLVTIASPLSEIARSRLQHLTNELSSAKPDATLGDLRDALLAMPEFAAAQVKPWLALGSDVAPLGRALALPGGFATLENWLEDAYAAVGITTLLSPSPAWIITTGSGRYATSQRMHLLDTGRIATASLGANPYIARLRAEGLEVRTFAGVLPPEP